MNTDLGARRKSALFVTIGQQETQHYYAIIAVLEVSVKRVVFAVNGLAKILQWSAMTIKVSV